MGEEPLARWLGWWGYAKTRIGAVLLIVPSPNWGARLVGNRLGAREGLAVTYFQKLIVAQNEDKCKVTGQPPARSCANRWRAWDGLDQLANGVNLLRWPRAQRLPILPLR